MTRAARNSYILVAAILIFMGGLHLTLLLLTVLFSHFALELLTFRRKKTMAVVIFLLTVAGLLFGSYSFIKLAAVATPKIANTTIPLAIKLAERVGIEPPFSDYAGLKAMAREFMEDQWGKIGMYARDLGWEMVSFIIGLVVAISLFLTTKVHLGEIEEAPQDNLYAVTGRQILIRFGTFYKSFVTVMGAQLLISAINTMLTAAFLAIAGFPFMALLVAVTFFCGLLPIVGNLISNTIVTFVALNVSPTVAVAALGYLIAIHKLEYFLNSKIIGSRIRNPMWMTLIGLVLGERLMGVPGMILAPVVLHYIKVEASRLEAEVQPKS